MTRVSPGTFPSVALYPGAPDSPATDYPNSIGDEARLDFAPVIDMHGDPDETLNVYLHALAFMFKEVDDIAKDGPNGEPGWSQIFDLQRAKTEWLPWMAQFVGYVIPIKPAGQPAVEYDATQRERIVTKSNWLRGTVTSLTRAAEDHLNDPKRVIVQERWQGNPYHIRVLVYGSEVKTSQAQLTYAVLADKTAGLIMNIVFLTGRSWDDLMISPYNTWQTARDHYIDWADVFNG